MYLTNAQIYRRTQIPNGVTLRKQKGSLFARAYLARLATLTRSFFGAPPSLPIQMLYSLCGVTATQSFIYVILSIRRTNLEDCQDQGVKGVSFHAGTPTYDKEQGGTRPYHWAESIYQKPNGMFSRRSTASLLSEITPWSRSQGLNYF